MSRYFSLRRIARGLLAQLSSTFPSLFVFIQLQTDRTKNVMMSRSVMRENIADQNSLSYVYKSFHRICCLLNRLSMLIKLYWTNNQSQPYRRFDSKEMRERDHFPLVILNFLSFSSFSPSSYILYVIAWSCLHSTHWKEFEWLSKKSPLRKRRRKRSSNG